ncbi:uncharacterized protein BCR38DRAFT_437251 [Pseudomassariella vexata]|uniref:Uncharacterized protein n=1 Tax=Pseudomassariella vexata TaxID=1141098 RepID=A0A1Y2DWV5_9PEZI|nr:uncharacterized protein BCR38DRAFT_437251 [Pseudomassariella vexata]ORY63584.1 hypothetical protein BCR38DRAFT_437251 [Pseudomassariella vexata]
MRFTSSLITLAAAFGVVHADSGCRVNMTSTLAAPANPGENILMSKIRTSHNRAPCSPVANFGPETMMKWRNSTESQMFSSVSIPFALSFTYFLL